MELLQKAIKIMLEYGSKEWQTFFCQMPGLMNEELLAQLQTNTQDMPAEIQERVDGFVKVAHHIEEQMRTIPAGYPIGSGPIEQLIERKKQGHMGLSVAKQQVREMAQNKELHPSYLSALSFRCVQLTYQGNPQDALDIQTLINEAAELMLDDTQHAIRAKLAAEFIRSASWILHEKGDASIYHQALSIGEQGMSHAITDNERAELHYVLGILNLDPYAANRSPDWYKVGIRQWFTAGKNPPGSELGKADGMPLPEEALDKAESQLRQAYQLSKGDMRRDTLKALVQTLESGKVLKRKPNALEIIALCDEALELLEKRPNPDQQSYVSAVRDNAVNNLKLTSTKKTLKVEPLAKLTKKMGGDAGRDAWITGIGLYIDDDPEGALHKIIKDRPLFMPEASEALKEALWRHELTAMSKLADQYANDDKYPVENIAVWSAVKSGLEASQSDNEFPAKEELISTTNQYPSVAQQHIDALRWLATVLEVGIGANAFNSRDIETAAQHYSLALLNFADLQLGNSCCEMLDRLNEIIPIAEGKSLEHVIIGLSEAGIRLDRLLGVRSQQVLSPVAATILQRCLETKEKKIGIIWTMEFAKGRVFRALHQQGKASPYTLSAELLDILSDIQALEDKVISDHPEEKGLSGESVLGAFQTQTAPSAGKDLNSQLRNLRLTFNESVTQYRLAQIVRQPTLITDETKITNQLPEKTVLLNMCDAGRKTITLAFTSGGAEGFIVDDQTELGGARIEMTDDTVSALYRSSALTAELLRKHVCAEPGPFEVDRKARLFLDYMLRRLIGHGVEKLQEWWDMGKRHLCIVPYGANHFLPIHLLTWNGKPLADQWTVSYLPNLSLLTDKPVGEQTSYSGSNSYAALGLSYDNHPYLPPIPSSIDELKSVAKSMSVTPIMNDNVTKTLVKQTLKNYSRIHISCHGKIYPESPELQHLFLAPNEKNEDKLYAYELSTLDLRHVDLVSLSACHSGLGRFDVNDNLRGIQANLFISGVSTIVDTLWDVSASAAETFFTVFYQQLHNDKTILESFQSAQVATRETYPAYRDWGAFRLSGKW